MGIKRKTKKQEYMAEKYLDDSALKEKLFDELEYSSLDHDFHAQVSEEDSAEEATEDPTAPLLHYGVREHTFWDKFHAFMEKEYTIYRTITGRLNRPKTYADNVYDDGAENERGLYDQFTFGIPWAVETLFRFNWIPHPTVRRVLAVIFSPVWLPLNLVRAAVGLIGTIIATPFVLFYEHYSEKASIKEEQNNLAQLNKEQLIEARSREEDYDQLNNVTDLVIGLTAPKPPTRQNNVTQLKEDKLPPALEAILKSRTEEQKRNAFTYSSAENDLPSVENLPRARDEGDYFEIKCQGVITSPYRVKPGETGHEYDAVIQLATEGNTADASKCSLIDEKQRKLYSTNRYSHWVVHTKISKPQDKDKDKAKTQYFAFIPPSEPVAPLDFPRLSPQIN